jgi:AcrR family transcriptional regulator
MAQSKSRNKQKPVREPPALSRDRICREALALVDEEGLDALSMRRLGARLGVEAMSLYRHVRDKADLLDALHTAVLGDLQPVGEPPPETPPQPLPKEGLGTEESREQRREESRGQRRAGDPWRALLGGLARALRGALLRHPNVVSLFATRPVRAPEALGTLELAWAALEQAGFRPDDARKAIVVVGVFTVGHVLGETHGEAAPQLGVPDSPGLAEFDFGLEALLDGIALRRASPLASEKKE